MKFLRLDLLLPLTLAFLAACRSAPISSGPPTSASGWALAPDLGADRPSGKSVHILCADPVRSKTGPAIESALIRALEAKGYTTTADPASADYLCRLTVRYLGRSVPPEGHGDVLKGAREPILAGDSGWLAADGSGVDTQLRKPRGLYSRPKARGFWGELFSGHEDDEWTLLLDLAIGTRSGELVQRHEGRLWARADATVLEKAAAIELLLSELEKRMPECLP